MSRTSNAIRNIKYAILGQGIGIIVSLLSRMFFVHTLSAEYLGLNGFFTNILSILSLAELGIGSSIVYSMYKPLAENDESKLIILMDLYKKAYITIGVIIAVLGFSLTPFLDFFIKDLPNIPHIRLIYFMFIGNSSLSYFFSYKRSLIITDQKRYIATFYRYSFFFLLNIFQIIELLIFHSYILFLLLQIVSTILENVYVSKKADELYPFLKNEVTGKLDKAEKDVIVRNVVAMLFHKIGSTIVKGTDNLLISKFIGIIEVGLYSNYQLVINALNSIFGLAFQSIIASIGNLGASETKEKGKYIFECINLVTFWIYAFSSICLINLINPFIKLWLGQEYVFSMKLVLVIVINFFLTGMRKSVLTFRDALGLFWYDRYKPLFESGINLVASIILVRKIGIVGIFIGTIISTLATCFWIEPFVLFKYGFKSTVKSYFKKYGIFVIIMLGVGITTWLLSNLFSSFTLLNFIGKLLVCIIVPNVLFSIIFWRTNEFQYLYKILKPIAYKFLKKKI